MAIQTKTITGSTSSSLWTWKMEIMETSTDVETNVSKVTVRSYLGRGSSGSYFGGSATCKIVCDGAERTSNKTFSYPTNVSANGWVLIQSEAFTIQHGSDGTKEISVTASMSNASFNPNSASASGKMELTTIPRASEVSGGSGNIGSPTRIIITRVSSSFKHTLKYEFKGLTGIIATGVDTSYNWTIPTSFYEKIPSSNTGTGTITCETYNGDVLIGTSTCEFTASVTNSAPTIGTLTYKDSNSTTTAITENNQRIIRNNSNLIFTTGTASVE